jgi:hypothetical protein
MSSFYFLGPEVPGALGERTELIQRPGTYPIVKRLHFEFSDGTFGDDLITTHPVFMATTRLADDLRRSGLSGFTLSTEIVVSVDEQVWLFQPDWKAPPLEWLQVTGVPGSDDFGLTGDARLVASGDALSVLLGHQIDHCEVTPVSGDIGAR